MCDNSLLFTDVYAGEAGSIHDYTLFRRSDLYNRIRTQQIPFFDDSHLIGDLAYKLAVYLLVGFKNNGHLTDRQKNFNVFLNKSRVRIEHAFGLLKGRFRRLKLLETVRVDLTSLLIVSACILHNICILRGDYLEDFIDLEAEAQEARIYNPHNEIDFVEEQQQVLDAINKRNDIVNALPLRIRQIPG